MTNDFKESLLKHLTGNVVPGTKQTTPYYEEFEYKRVSDGSFIAGTYYIKCKDGNGNYNGKLLYYASPVYQQSHGTKLTLVDENLNILHEYTSFNTGTVFNKIIGLGVAEDGTFYGIDYSLDGKYRIILLNNLSEKSKVVGGYDYKCILRNSYFIQGYTEDDDISPNWGATIQKSQNSATYYFSFTDSVNQTIMPSTFVINVGSTNTWTRLQDVVKGQGTLLDTFITFDTNDSPTAEYYTSEEVYDSGDIVDWKITKAKAEGDGAPEYTTTLEGTKALFNSGATYSDYSMDLKVISDNFFYLSLYGRIPSSSNYKQRVKVLSFTNGVQNELYKHDGLIVITSPYVAIPYFNSVLDNGTLYFYYGFLSSDDINSRKNLYVNVVSPEIKESGISFYKDTGRTIPSSPKIVLSSNYYLKKLLIKYNDGSYTETDITSIMYDPYIYNGGKYNDIYDTKPNIGILKDSNNKLMFARKLYNNKVYQNRTISTLNVPYNALNDTPITTNGLLGETNMTLYEGNLGIEKNIYEDLYINLFHTIQMENRNTSTYIPNMGGATKINMCLSNKDTTYEDSKATRFRINYDDGTYLDKTTSAIITNNIATYKLTIYVPEDKNISSIDILSNDGNTVYQEIKEGLESLENDKFYNIYQDVYVE